MLMALIVVFLGAFAVAALLLMALGPGKSAEAKQVQATLDSALATDTPEARDQLVDLRKNSTLSTIPWLNSKLTGMRLTPALSLMLQQANLNWMPGALLVGSGAAFVLVAWVLYLKFSNLLISLAAGLACATLPFLWVILKRRKRFNKFMEGLPEALDMMVSALRVGHSLQAAMGLVGRECADPVGGEFKICFEEQNYGLEMKAAMDNLLQRVPLQDLRIVSTAIMIQKESGGNLAEVLDKTAQVIRGRFRLKRQIGTHTAQGRLTGMILAAVPVVLGIIFYVLNPKQMSILWTDPLGIKLLWAGVVMQVIGALVIRKIVDIDV